MIYFVGGSIKDYFLETKQIVCLSRGCTTDTVEKNYMAELVAVMGFSTILYVYLIRFGVIIAPSLDGTVYTQGSHTRIIAHADA